MKYGLRSDDSKKMKWKMSMEQDIANLKIEVSTLKQQLKSSLDIISLLFSERSSKSPVKGLDISDGTMFMKYFPAWAYDPSTQQYACYHSVITKDKSLEELRLEDYNLNSRFFNQNGGFTKVQNHIGRMPVEDTRPHKQDEPLSQITSQLGKINENMTFVTNQLSKMDINLSEINSQMSVMDSKLSAIDMFVTMQQVDKKWQELTPRLQAIENNPKSSVLSNNNNIKDRQCYSPQGVSLNNSTDKVCDVCQDAALIITKDAALMTNSSNFENNLEANSEIEFDHLNCNSNVVVSFEKAKLEEDKISNNSSFRTSIGDKPENSKLQIVAKIKVRNSGSGTEQQNSSTSVSSKSGSEVFYDSNQLTQRMTKCPKENTLVGAIKNDTFAENLSDVENEFVLIQKSDVCGDSDEAAKTNTCSNITEYLEVNFKKNKDSVYEFAFNKYLRDRQILRAQSIDTLND